MTQLDYLLQTGHWQVLIDSRNHSPEEREAAKEAFVEKCLKPVLEELDELRDILFNDPMLSVLSHVHPISRLRRLLDMFGDGAEYTEELKDLLAKARTDCETIQNRYDANTPYIAGLETRVKAAEQQRDRAVMLHTDMESQYWAEVAKLDVAEKRICSEEAMSAEAQGDQFDAERERDKAIKERDEAQNFQAQAEQQTADLMHAECDEWEQLGKELEDMKTYARHKDGCSYDPSRWNDGPTPCDCGLVEALALPKWNE